MIQRTLVIALAGGVLSTVKLRVTVAAVLPAWSTALTTSAWAISVLTCPPLLNGTVSSVAVTVAGVMLKVFYMFADRSKADE